MLIHGSLHTTSTQVMYLPWHWLICFILIYVFFIITDTFFPYSFLHKVSFNIWSIIIQIYLVILCCYFCIGKRESLILCVQLKEGSSEMETQLEQLQSNMESITQSSSAITSGLKVLQCKVYWYVNSAGTLTPLLSNPHTVVLVLLFHY